MAVDAWIPQQNYREVQVNLVCIYEV